MRSNRPHPSFNKNTTIIILQIQKIMGKVTRRGDLLGVNSFAKLYDISREEVMRIILRHQVDAILIPDGNRYYIDNRAILAEAKIEGITPGTLVRRFCRQSKR